jgi:hypothetical protein
MKRLQSKWGPQLNDWFQPVVEYSGNGVATCTGSTERLEGRCRLRFDDRGNPSIAMLNPTVTTRGHASAPVPFEEPIEGEQPPKPPLVALAVRETRCEQLRVETSDGVFTSIVVNGMSGVELTEEGSSIAFSIPVAQFETRNPAPAHYWVMPLANFISDFTVHVPTLDQHPLRIYKITPIPEEKLDDAEAEVIYEFLYRRPLIPFVFVGALGFIERLPDYDDRRHRLLNGSEKYLITSVVVGAVGDYAVDSDTLDDWFPFDFLHLLGFATGSEIGTPWIEFRDANGGLVKRIHRSLGKPCFEKGMGAIDEGGSPGTGDLLTVAATSPLFNTSRLRVTLRQAIRGGLANRTVEDQLSNIFRALDGLCEHQGTSERLLLTEVNADQLEKVNIIRANFVNRLERMAKQAAAGDNLGEAAALRRIKGNLGNITKVAEEFGPGVVALLEKCGLNDAVIINRYMAQNPYSDRIQNWGDLLSHYRGTTFHEGYFDVQGKEAEKEELINVCFHLRDVLFRVILRLIGYEGRYSVRVANRYYLQSIDWVTDAIPASRLGYSWTPRLVEAQGDQ